MEDKIQKEKSSDPNSNSELKNMIQRISSLEMKVDTIATSLDSIQMRLGMKKTLPTNEVKKNHLVSALPHLPSDLSYSKKKLTESTKVSKFDAVSQQKIQKEQNFIQKKLASVPLLNKDLLQHKELSKYTRVRSPGINDNKSVQQTKKSQRNTYNTPSDQKKPYLLLFFFYILLSVTIYISFLMLIRWLEEGFLTFLNIFIYIYILSAGFLIAGFYLINKYIKSQKSQLFIFPWSFIGLGVIGLSLAYILPTAVLSGDSVLNVIIWCLSIISLIFVFIILLIKYRNDFFIGEVFLSILILVLIPSFINNQFLGIYYQNLNTIFYAALIIVATGLALKKISLTPLVAVMISISILSFIGEFSEIISLNLSLIICVNIIFGRLLLKGYGDHYEFYKNSVVKFVLLIINQILPMAAYYFLVINIHHRDSSSIEIVVLFIILQAQFYIQIKEQIGIIKQDLSHDLKTPYLLLVFINHAVQIFINLITLLNFSLFSRVIWDNFAVILGFILSFYVALSMTQFLEFEYSKVRVFVRLFYLLMARIGFIICLFERNTSDKPAFFIITMIILGFSLYYSRTIDGSGEKSAISLQLLITSLTNFLILQLYMGDLEGSTQIVEFILILCFFIYPFIVGMKILQDSKKDQFVEYAKTKINLLHIFLTSIGVLFILTIMQETLVLFSIFMGGLLITGLFGKFFLTQDTNLSKKSVLQYGILTYFASIYLLSLKSIQFFRYSSYWIIFISIFWVAFQLIIFYTQINVKINTFLAHSINIIVILVINYSYNNLLATWTKIVIILGATLVFWMKNIISENPISTSSYMLILNLMNSICVIFIFESDFTQFGLFIPLVFVLLLIIELSLSVLDRQNHKEKKSKTSNQDQKLLLVNLIFNFGFSVISFAVIYYYGSFIQQTFISGEYFWIQIILLQILLTFLFSYHPKMWQQLGITCLSGLGMLVGIMDDNFEFNFLFIYTAVIACTCIVSLLYSNRPKTNEKYLLYRFYYSLMVVIISLMMTGFLSEVKFGIIFNLALFAGWVIANLEIDYHIKFQYGLIALIGISYVFFIIIRSFSRDFEYISLLFLVIGIVFVLLLYKTIKAKENLPSLIQDEANS
ncbi:hypothetical protein NEF87_000707 [Candidatus Lokiarchaeum ossiferum]|uniref:DUF2339 domain-containing protein n=1 Tax=Candidatus Lokiarchaeum ossiferum TaxID=2951803 RepID=A0ABY6HPW4_9ARCH|nr:hypothetical protein NEF87_000707 [Candidatus Lokiarchaeum sp. B-35]